MIDAKRRLDELTLAAHEVQTKLDAGATRNGTDDSAKCRVGGTNRRWRLRLENKQGDCMKEIALYYLFMNAIKISVVPAKAGGRPAGTTGYVLLAMRFFTFMQLPWENKPAV